MDANGGDYGPSVVVPGSVAAAQQLGARCRVVLVGDEPAIRGELDACGASPDLVDIVHAPDNIDMSEAPATAIRRKPESSIVVGANLTKSNDVQAFVSAGSTGAMTAASLLIVGRVPGVARPGIASLLPTRRGIGLFLDVGANSDCKPKHILQFAAMGRIYAEHVLRLPSPTVGLLNIGEEPSKGNELSLEAHRLLAQNEPAFIGNVEGREIFDGKASVIVMDGFVGNVVLKILESCYGFIGESVKNEIRNDPRAMLGGWLIRPAVQRLGKRFHYEQYGGAPLLGCNGVIIICHGGSSPEAITNAIKVAERGVRDRVPERIRVEIEAEEARLKASEAGSDDPAPDPTEGARHP